MDFLHKNHKLITDIIRDPVEVTRHKPTSLDTVKNSKLLESFASANELECQGSLFLVNSILLAHQVINKSIVRRASKAW